MIVLLSMGLDGFKQALEDICEFFKIVPHYLTAILVFNLFVNFMFAILLAAIYSLVILIAKDIKDS